MMNIEDRNLVLREAAKCLRNGYCGTPLFRIFGVQGNTFAGPRRSWRKQKRDVKRALAAFLESLQLDAGDGSLQIVGVDQSVLDQLRNERAQQPGAVLGDGDGAGRLVDGD